MKEETLKTGKDQKDQIGYLQARKQKEREDFIQPPEVFYTDKELAELRVEAEAKNQEQRAYSSSFAKDQLNQHLGKLQASQDERRQKIADEEAHLARLRKLQEQETNMHRRNREDRRTEMNSTLSTLEQRKRAEWEAKKNDKTNKMETEKLQTEINYLTKASIEDQHRQKSQYNQELSSLTAAQRAQMNADREQSRMEEAKAKGLTFECYTRDQMMKEATKDTGSYQLQQKQFEAERKQHERASLIEPPPSLVTTQQLNEMQQEALKQDMEKRSGLKEVMKKQYIETQAEKAARIKAERDVDAQEAARHAALNSEMTRIERVQNANNKSNYSKYLSGQLSEAEQRKRLDNEERRYDPNVEKLVEENARIGERILKCGKCDCTLAHERTFLEGSSNGHSH